MSEEGWEWWAENGAPHVTPTGERHAEGFDAGNRAADLLMAFSAPSPVVEFGCGDGRLAHAFWSDEYVGLDVCEESLAAARARHAAHDFRLYAPWSPLPAGSVVAWNVLMHLPDEDLPRFVELVEGRVVLVAECMSRLWRRKGSPPVYNRDAVEYEEAFASHRVVGIEQSKVERYANEGAPRDVFTILVLEPR